MDMQYEDDGRATILAVDDTPENLAVIGGLLRPHYHVRVANSGERALHVAATPPRPDLILLDVMMPGLDGYGVLARLRADPVLREIPVIFVTAMDQDEDEQRGLELGAVDYIPKPIRPAVLLARVRTHLDLKRARDLLRNQNDYLEREVARRMHENELVKDLSLHALAMLAETRDPETGYHLQRTSAYVEALARRLQQHPRYGAQLDGPTIKLIAKAAPLHDIGKVGIPDHILLKPGRLTPAEFEIMKTHAQIGAQAIEKAMRRVLGDSLVSEWGGRNSVIHFMEIARQIAGCHHEKWDGSGYPQGLAGESIPLSARLMALADVYDALSCRRVYKQPFPIEDVMRIIVEGRGHQFDPDLVDALLDIQQEFLEIGQRYADPQVSVDTLL